MAPPFIWRLSSKTQCQTFRDTETAPESGRSFISVLLPLFRTLDAPFEATVVGSGLAASACLD